ncbi:MAG: DNA gyrase inhibitor YacG [Minicystis sp.]
MGSRAPHVCPICAREVGPRDGTPKNPAFPFCSPSCKLVDLGRWLDGAYRVPAEDEASSIDGEASSAIANGAARGEEDE